MDVLDQYVPDPGRYDGRMPYRRCGRSGLDLPAISLGLWQNFGDDQPLATQRAILRRAFDLGVTHFDLANNYGPPYGSAELNFGRILREDLRPLPRRAGDLDEGGLRHVARALRRPRLAEVPALEPGAVADPDGARPRRRLLLAPARRRTRRWRRRWAPWTRPSARARPATPASRPTAPPGPPRRRASCATSGRRCSSTSRPTRCSTAGSRRTCSTSSGARASAASSSRRSRRGC